MRKSVFKKVAAAFCAAVLTIAMTCSCFAADRWTTYFGQNAGWYEGGLGEASGLSDTGWTAKLEQIGWGGVWGAQIKDESLALDPDTEYALSFDLTSDTIDKWVFVKVANDNDDLLFGEWLQLKAGKKTSYSKTFTVSEKATKIVFGIGGDFGDRTDESEMYKLTSTLPDDVDATYATTIKCENFSLAEAAQEEDKADKTSKKDKNKDKDTADTADDAADTDASSGTSTGSTSTSTSTGTGAESTATTTPVQTGDFTPVALAGMAVAAAAIIVVFTRKRHDA